MAHNSKRWIQDWRGRVKRSRDRTRRDYYGELMGESWRDADTRFCPQCKHVKKYKPDDIGMRRSTELYARYQAETREAAAAWHAYRTQGYDTYVDHHGHVRFKALLPMPKVPEPPAYWRWIKDHKHEVPVPWTYDARTFLCFRCEERYETKREMWHDHVPGCKAHYTWTRRRQYRDFRVQGKQLLRLERYDEVPTKYVPGWLD